MMALRVLANVCYLRVCILRVMHACTTACMMRTSSGQVGPKMVAVHQPIWERLGRSGRLHGFKSDRAPRKRET